MWCLQNNFGALINVIKITLERFCYFILLEFEKSYECIFFFRQLNASVVQIMLTGLSVQFLLYYSDVNVLLYHLI